MRSRITGCCENMTTLGRLFEVEVEVEEAVDIDATDDANAID